MASQANTEKPGVFDEAVAPSAAITVPMAGEGVFLWFYFFEHPKHSPRFPILHGTGKWAGGDGDGRRGRGERPRSPCDCHGLGLPGAVCGRRRLPGGPLGPLDSPLLLCFARERADWDHGRELLGSLCGRYHCGATA